MTRILAAVPLDHDATSYYRAFGVFQNLRKKYIPDLYVENFVGGGKRAWPQLYTFDILFMQRPAFPEWLQLAKYMKKLNKKIWIDHDDNLFELPPYNRVVDTYNPVVKKAMLDMMKLADVVTVSTPALQKYFMDNFAIESIVIPNALNDELTPMAEHYNEPTEIEKFTWRGSDTHQADLMEFSEPITMAMRNRPNTFWDYLGFNPFYITMTVPQSKWNYHLASDIMIYTENLRGIKAQVLHVPLIEDGLNNCKSNIAWIEATAAGAVTIAPDWPEWQRPGILNYSSIEEYGSLLMRPIDDAKERWQASRDYIKENLLLTHVNKQRAEIIQNLCH